MPYSFTSVEGVFWVALGFVVVFFILQGVPLAYQFLAMSNALTLFVFGFADFVENLFFSSDPDAKLWLLALRGVCILLLGAAIFWFYMLRRREAVTVTQKHKV